MCRLRASSKQPGAAGCPPTPRRPPQRVTEPTRDCPLPAGARKDMSSSEAAGLRVLDEYANGFMVSQVGTRGQGCPTKLAYSSRGAAGTHRFMGKGCPVKGGARMFWTDRPSPGPCSVGTPVGICGHPRTPSRSDTLQSVTAVGSQRGRGSDILGGSTHLCGTVWPGAAESGAPHHRSQRAISEALGVGVGKWHSCTEDVVPCDSPAGDGGLSLSYTVCTPVSPAAPFTVAKPRKQPKCPGTEDWVRQPWCTPTTECYSATGEGTRNRAICATRGAPAGHHTARSKPDREKQES